MVGDEITTDDIPTSMFVYRDAKQQFDSAKRTTESELDRDLRNSDMLKLLLRQFDPEEINTDNER